MNFGNNNYPLSESRKVARPQEKQTKTGRKSRFEKEKHLREKFSESILDHSRKDRRFPSSQTSFIGSDICLCPFHWCKSFSINLGVLDWWIYGCNDIRLINQKNNFLLCQLIHFRRISSFSLILYLRDVCCTWCTWWIKRTIYIKLLIIVLGLK